MQMLIEDVSPGLALEAAVLYGVLSRDPNAANYIGHFTFIGRSELGLAFKRVCFPRLRGASARDVVWVRPE